jgi:hypothetical protein
VPTHNQVVGFGDFIPVGPTQIREKLVVQLGQSWPFEQDILTSPAELSWDGEGHWGYEPLDPCFCIWVLLKFPVQLAILIVCAVKRLEGN